MTSTRKHTFGIALGLALLSGVACAGASAARAPADAQPAAAAAQPAKTGGQAQQAVLEELVAGNRAFVAGEPEAVAEVGPARRAALVQGQHPKAMVLSCADSRVPPEHVFHQGLGDLFVVRVAGNLPVSGAVGSLEYSAEHLGTEVLVVLGHSSCGAVSAAVSGAHATGDLAQLVHAIEPAVAVARQHVGASAKPEELLADAIHENAHLAAQKLVQESPVLREKVESGHLKIVVGLYDLATGRVSFDDAHVHGPGAPRVP